MEKDNLIKGIGVDVEKIERFSGIKNKNFINKVFTEAELKYCLSKKDPSPHLAVRFSAKEAVYKALRDSVKKKLSYKEIEIVKQKNGAPKIRINNNSFKDNKVLISLSHTKELAIAMAVVI